MAEPRKFPRTILAALMMAAELIATHPAVASSLPIEDRWLTDDRKAVVLIASCGAALCGTIHQIRDKGPRCSENRCLQPRSGIAIAVADRAAHPFRIQTEWRQLDQWACL